MSVFVLDLCFWNFLSFPCCQRFLKQRLFPRTLALCYLKAMLLNICVMLSADSYILIVLRMYVGLKS